MNDVTATIGIEQLKYVAETLKKHRANAARYDEAFENLELVKPMKYKKDRLSSYWLYTIRVKNRQKFMEHMKEAGIVVSKVHARNDTHSMFREFKTALPGVDEFNLEQLSIPVGWWLEESHIKHIIDTVLEYQG
jgi:dTDP-4-amino-4,6-dideoxygalactose transaminase